MGNRMTCATTPKYGVSQGVANKGQTGAPPPPPPTGAGGGGVAQHLSAEVVAQNQAVWVAKMKEGILFAIGRTDCFIQSAKLRKFDVGPCHSAQVPTSTEAFDFFAMICAANKLSATTKPLAPLISEQTLKTSMHQIFMDPPWRIIPSIFLKWTMQDLNFFYQAELNKSGATA
jgi:hypothetical protein